MFAGWSKGNAARRINVAFPRPGAIMNDQSEWPDTIAPSKAGDTIPAATATNIEVAGDDPPCVEGYEPLESLGRGGMGVVYKARDLAKDRIVALKVIRGGLSDEPEWLDRFKAEAIAVAKLKHRHIVKIYDAGHRNGIPFLAMEYMEGGSLDRLIRDRPPTPIEAARLVEKLTLAVEHAHHVGIIHRDLKPANILLDRNGEPKIGDFGLAKHLERSEEFVCTIALRFDDLTVVPIPRDRPSGPNPDLEGDEAAPQTVLIRTRYGVVLGTPRYMAPEQSSGGYTGEIGPRTDVYALGAILFELLTGSPPPLLRFDPSSRLAMRFEGTIPSPVEVRPGIPQALGRICMKCLEIRDFNRYEHARLIGQDLRAYLDPGAPAPPASPKAQLRPLVRTALGRLFPWFTRG